METANLLTGKHISSSYRRAMFIFFRRHHRYVVDRPIEQVESKLKWIVTRRWDDHSMDIIGRMNGEGKFRITSKWSLMPVKWIENRPGYIEGRISPEAEGTHIEITTKPNRILVSLFYLLLIFLVLEASGIVHFLSFEKKYRIAVLAALVCLLLAAIVLLKNEVKKRFEQLMQLK